LPAVIAEFGGEAEASVTLSRMAQEILDWRSRIKQIAEFPDIGYTVGGIPHRVLSQLGGNL
jgi:hypothetical protein